MDRVEPIASVASLLCIDRVPGTVSGLIDANEDGLDDFDSFRPLDPNVYRAAVVLSEVRRLGPAAFVSVTASPSTPPSGSAWCQGPCARAAAHVVKAMQTVGTDSVCQLDDCDGPVERSNSRYCSKAHR